MWNFISKGGYLMYPLLFSSILALAIILERTIMLHRLSLPLDPLLEKIKELLSRGKILEAIESCEKYNLPLSRVLRVGLLHHERDSQIIQELMETQLEEEMPLLERHLGILATLAAVSPRLGLLGTVSGMVKIFATIEAGGGAVDPGSLAGGIWEALLTTVFGLMIAIPSLIAYNYFTSRTQNLVREIRLGIRKLLQILETASFV